MRPKIAILSGSFNPPGTHHRAIAEALGPLFDRVIVIPSGPRPDQALTNDVEPWHRAALADIAFRDLPKVEVELFDVELLNFTSNDQFEERYASQGELWHVVGAELSEGGAHGESGIQRWWQCGTAVWERLNFCVVVRLGHEEKPEDLPPKHMVVRLDRPTPTSSAEIREKIFRRVPYDTLVPEGVMAYIERYGLYRGRIPSRRTRWKTEQPRLMIVADERNAKAMEMAAEFRHWEDRDDPTAVLVLGGDGTMLHAIREHWRRRIPFLGLNQGHLGFLLNEPEAVQAASLPQAEWIVRLMPMLYVEVETTGGERKSELAFNDAWVERSTSQSAWMEVAVNDQVRIKKLVADGALVCTAGGSTAYARAMGVAPLLADMPGWILVGSNVMTPNGWKSALLGSDSTVTIRSIGGEKRPLCAYIDGRPMGGVVSFCARLSRIATVELAFSAKHDMAEKISRIMFPAAE